MSNTTIGTTEQGDAGLDLSWFERRHEYGGLVLITKRLSPAFIEKAAATNSIVHATITGWGGTALEPRVPSFQESERLFRELVDTIGANRVVLRIDPILPTAEGIARARAVYKILHEDFVPRTRVRISFVDNYPHVRANFKKAGLSPLPYDFHAPLEQRMSLYTQYFSDAEICGEPGMPCSGCISSRDADILGVVGADPRLKGQRKSCLCIAAKEEIFAKRQPCKHGCLYCYWKA